MNGVFYPAGARPALHTVLRAKAKASPDYRFYTLYDKLHRADVLAHAFDRCRTNGGAQGQGGGWNRRHLYDAKVVNMTVDPDTWHEGVIEARRREQRVLLDGRELSAYTLLIGDTTKTGSVSA